MSIGENTFHEINSQPSVWGQTLNSCEKQLAPLASLPSQIGGLPVLVTGCGSTHYLSLSAAAILRKVGLAARALPASELVHYPEMLPERAALLLAISRSGTTTETLWAVERFRQRYPAATVVTVTTLPDATLAGLADFVLSAPSAQEKSIAQTRSFTSMFLLSQALAGALAGDQSCLARLRRLPGALRALFENAGDLPRRLAGDLSLQRFFYLGGGPLYGLACEAMIKTKEITCSWAEAFHPLEFRHGPMAVAGPGALVVGFLSDSGAPAEQRLLQDMHGLGATTLAIGEALPAGPLEGLDYAVDLACGLDQWDRGPLYLPLVQQMAYYRALEKGLDPDRPTHLSMVVELS
jgi:glucosamine--fructose-6-phosphate aminotransferase (isomerizing)